MYDKANRNLLSGSVCFTVYVGGDAYPSCALQELPESLSSSQVPESCDPSAFFHRRILRLEVRDGKSILWLVPPTLWQLPTLLLEVPSVNGLGGH